MNQYEYKRRWNPPGWVWIAWGEVVVELGLGTWLFFGFQNHPSKLLKLMVVLAIALNRSLAKIYNTTTLSIRNGAFVRKTGPFFFWRGRRVKIRQSDITGAEIKGDHDDNVTVEIITQNNHRTEIDWNLTRDQAEQMLTWLYPALDLK